MYLQDAAGASGCFCPELLVATTNTGSLRLSSTYRGLPAGDVLLCGQSRTTIKARCFAALIGRLWIGGY